MHLEEMSIKGITRNFSARKIMLILKIGEINKLGVLLNLEGWNIFRETNIQHFIYSAITSIKKLSRRSEQIIPRQDMGVPRERSNSRCMS